jgi:hypothetical protein|eukprot:SAG25_NODE_1293_length_3372_cov_1.915063_2_plen_105_part_00
MSWRRVALLAAALAIGAALVGWLCHADSPALRHVTAEEPLSPARMLQVVRGFVRHRLFWRACASLSCTATLKTSARLLPLYFSRGVGGGGEEGHSLVDDARGAR